MSRWRCYSSLSWPKTSNCCRRRWSTKLSCCPDSASRRCWWMMKTSRCWWSPCCSSMQDGWVGCQSQTSRCIGVTLLRLPGCPASSAAAPCCSLASLCRLAGGRAPPRLLQAAPAARLSAEQRGAAAGAADAPGGRRGVARGRRARRRTVEAPGRGSRGRCEVLTGALTNCACPEASREGHRRNAGSNLA